MVEAKKCQRCGCMYISENDVCEKCQKKDGADLYRLKGFFATQEMGGEISQGEIAIATGISSKNLSRFLGSDEFKGIFAGLQEKANVGNTNEEGNFVELA